MTQLIQHIDVLNFDKVDKKEVLEGVEDFLKLFESFYKNENAVLDLNPTNLFFTKEDLVCFDLQKFHKDTWKWEEEKKPRDIYHILNNILDVNQ